MSDIPNVKVPQFRTQQKFYTIPEKNETEDAYDDKEESDDYFAKRGRSKHVILREK